MKGGKASTFKPTMVSTNTCIMLSFWSFAKGQIDKLSACLQWLVEDAISLLKITFLIKLMQKERAPTLPAFSQLQFTFTFLPFLLSGCLHWGPGIVKRCSQNGSMVFKALTSDRALTKSELLHTCLPLSAQGSGACTGLTHVCMLKLSTSPSSPRTKSRISGKESAWPDLAPLSLPLKRQVGEQEIMQTGRWCLSVGNLVLEIPWNESKIYISRGTLDTFFMFWYMYVITCP